MTRAIIKCTVDIRKTSRAMDNHKFEYMSTSVHENRRHQRWLRRRARGRSRGEMQKMLVPRADRISSAVRPSLSSVTFSGEVSLATVFARFARDTWEGEAPTRGWTVMWGFIAWPSVSRWSNFKVQFTRQSPLSIRTKADVTRGHTFS